MEDRPLFTDRHYKFGRQRLGLVFTTRKTSDRYKRDVSVYGLGIRRQPKFERTVRKGRKAGSSVLNLKIFCAFRTF